MTISALLVFEEELEKRSFLEWLASHVAGSLPPHRYLGNVELTGRFIKFIGKDTQLNAETDIFIERSSITEVYHGYDDTYNIFQGRGIGLIWAPVRIKFKDASDLEKVAYFIVGYNSWGTSDKEFYTLLVKWLS